MNKITNLLKKQKQFINIIEQKEIRCSNEESFAFYAFYKYISEQKQIVVVMENLLACQNVYNKLSMMLKDKVYMYCVDEVTKFTTLATSPEMVSQRIYVLNKLIEQEPIIVVTHTMAIKRLVPSKITFMKNCFDLKVDQECSLNDIIFKLVKMGYQNVLKVTQPFEFSTRGGVIDIFSINYEKPINIYFKGIIDKIIYTTKDDKTYVAIIDYKTSNPEIDVSKVKYGLSMQLPIYLYLLKHAKELKNVVVCGFYLQKLIPSQSKFGLDYLDILKDSVALQGYSNADTSILSLLDPGYENSSLIKSMKIKKDGTFSTYAKVLTSEQMQEIAEMVEDKILTALEEICNCNFTINPKIVEGKNVSCKFCEFKDCCFFNHNDLCYLDNSDLIDEDGE